jgi:hypothetical protein
MARQLNHRFWKTVQYLWLDHDSKVKALSQITSLCPNYRKRSTLTSIRVLWTCRCDWFYALLHSALKVRLRFCLQLGYRQWRATGCRRTTRSTCKHNTRSKRVIFNEIRTHSNLYWLAGRSRRTAAEYRQRMSLHYHNSVQFVPLRTIQGSKSGQKETYSLWITRSVPVASLCSIWKISTADSQYSSVLSTTNCYPI